MVEHPAEYPWSSAAAHLGEEDRSGILDLDWWRREGPKNWKELLAGALEQQEFDLRNCTYSGKPFGEENFVKEMAERFGRYWNRGRPKKKNPTGKRSATKTVASDEQFPLF